MLLAIHYMSNLFQIQLCSSGGGVGVLPGAGTGGIIGGPGEFLVNQGT